MNDDDAWMAKIEEGRIEKDKFLSTDSQSPIPMMKRRKFKDLEYYPADPKFAFKLELQEHVDYVQA